MLANVSDFTISTKNWNTNLQVDILPDHIINTMNTIPISASDIKDSIKQKFMPHNDFSIKNAPGK